MTAELLTTKRGFVENMTRLVAAIGSWFWGTNQPAKLGGEIHESKVVGTLASTSSGICRLDGILLCNFDGFGLFVWL